ncbi:hypothetical protein Syun_003802 [Stephania yunnanensis]|uniref:Uncharacterized protein n=1 Tax=Stephania yunnanensis TaxID=152371 RepID=A0AAP0L4F9_9MAGN
MAKFCPELRVLEYVGDKEQRCSLRRMVFDSVKQQLSYSNGSTTGTPAKEGLFINLEEGAPYATCIFFKGS